jgi:hypothetical protein
MVNAVREKVRELDKDVALGRPITMDEVLGDQTQQPRFNMALFSGSGRTSEPPLAQARALYALCLRGLGCLSWSCVSSVALHVVESTFCCGFDSFRAHQPFQSLKRFGRIVILPIVSFLCHYWTR